MNAAAGGPQDRAAFGPGDPVGRRSEERRDGARGADAVFAALADPTRRRLLDELSEGGPQSATELAPGYAMSRQAVVKHLGVLADAGLVTTRRDGRDVRYQLEPDPLADATAWLADVGRRWDRRLDALRRHLSDRAATDRAATDRAAREN